MDKDARNIYPIHPLLKKRWSPRAFNSRPVEPEKLRSIFEAARWSPSASNEQPWNFMLGLHGDETWEKIFGTLDEWNQRWVGQVPVLLMSIGRKVRARRRTPYTHFQYDTGQSVAHLTFEAMNQGLHVHQMSGFNPEKAIVAFSIPDDHIPLTVIAVGYLTDPSVLPPYYQEREAAERIRKSFNEFIFIGKFGDKPDLF